MILPLHKQDLLIPPTPRIIHRKLDDVQSVDRKLLSVNAIMRVSADVSGTEESDRT